MPNDISPGQLKCFNDVNEMTTFYAREMAAAYESNESFEPSWNDAMQWTRLQNLTDVHAFLQARAQVVSHCLQDEATRKMMQYVGTAATTRDLVAMADAFDGPGSPVNFWSMYEGSLVGSHLLSSM